MEKEPEVFSSNITRSAKPLKNDLFDLLKRVPAQPVTQKRSEKRGYCDFQPRNDKHFEPKKKTKYKVRTVRDIRNSFEIDVYSSLPAELEKQQNVLLRKIRSGTSRDENTKTLAKNMFKSDKPISRSAWQMLMNLNPEDCANSTQFVLWNGRRIQVNGSKGGKFKFICKYDLGVKNIATHSSKIMKRKLFNKRKGLLRNSLSINFKPGPLTKKRILDNSYQKYHVGGIELVDLPTPGLEITPALGKTVDPTIAQFLHQMTQVDGTISNKWAEFSASVLATVKDKHIISIEEESSVTFNLSYKCNQQRILMRRDVSSDFHTEHLFKNKFEPTATSEDLMLTSEIKNLLDKMLDSVDISINQDYLFTGEDEPRDVETETNNSNGSNISAKDRLKRKCGELERLDVTIIRLSEIPDINPKNACHKAQCSLGCICASLECAYNLKSHCGRIECMFECKCNFSKYKVVDSLERCSEFVPGLLNIDNEMFSKMAKEEQKFHQTVIVTSENSMHLKSKRRHWKSSKKYADFYSNMCLKAEDKSDKVSEVVLDKLNLDNVEPWCMVHNLYKCFCKGRFTDHSIPEVITDDTNVTSLNNFIQKNNLSMTEDQTQKYEKNTEKYNLKPHMTSASFNNLPHDKPYDSSHNLAIDYDSDIIYDGKSARIKPFHGRKYTDEHYFNANKKIMEMEKHDNTLRNRMIHLINISTSKNMPRDQDVHNIKEIIHTTDTIETSTQSKKDVLPPAPSHKTSISNIKLFSKRPDKENLVAWLETSYKNYRRRVDQGIVKISLDPPKLGKMALYPWEFILSRYRDQKNLFLISKQPQYRIFMAVDTKNPFFDNCININDIRFADLHKYPITVKNLLTNAKDLKDNFCILCGLSSCWELIGSVTKICEQQKTTRENQISTGDENINFPAMSADVCETDSEDSFAATSVHYQHSVEETTNTGKETTNDRNTTSDSSKWFVMTVENDFDEIQFYNKGFFVKLESIIKAINVARVSEKTVRLSSQKCVDNAGPQFGIYAIPNKIESCVFVGPYEKDELLGIETVKKNIDIRTQKRTRGVWITTKKLENFKVIDNPLSFLPPKNAPVTEMMTLSGESLSSKESLNKELPTQSTKDSKRTPSKPIKIRKTNGFYQLAPNGTLKQIPVQQIHLHNAAPTSDENHPQILNAASTKFSETPLNSLLNNITPYISATLIPMHKKPVAEIAPHVKTTNKSPESLLAKIDNSSNKKERGMFILKPEEINKRLMENQMPTNSEMKVDAHDCTMNTRNDQELEMDIEKFLATAEECMAPNDDVLIISDDENDIVNASQLKPWQDVWIECKSVESLGYIPGRRNKEGLLSFEFPGFKYTEFYKTEDAYAKLNQVLSRKIYIPKNVYLEWHLIESEQDLGTKQMLKAEDLGPDFVMTKRGIRHKQNLASSKFLIKNQITAEPAAKSVDNDSKAGENTKGTITLKDKPKDCIKDLEAASQLLEDEREILWNKLTSNSDNSEALNNLREQIAARLQNMVSDT